jgi:zinc/manganese transport system permease protein
VLSLIHSDVKASVFISMISFAFYVLARVAAKFVLPAFSARRRAPRPSSTLSETLADGHATDRAPDGAAVASVATSEREDGVG